MWLRHELSDKRHQTQDTQKKKKGEKDEPIYNNRIKSYYKTRWIVERTNAWSKTTDVLR